MKLSKEDLKPVSIQVRAQVWTQVGDQVKSQVIKQIWTLFRNPM
jgi:hypothetical protein